MRVLSEFRTLTLSGSGPCLHPLDRELAGAELRGLGLQREASRTGRSGGATARWWSCTRMVRSALRGVGCVPAVRREAGVRIMDGRGSTPSRRIRDARGRGRVAKRFRLPTSRDLALVACERRSTKPLRSARACRLGTALSSSARRTRSTRWERIRGRGSPRRDAPGADCPECDREWKESLDLTSFVWAEVESRARRLLVEVHPLASAYGWSEAETFALSEARRAIYLEMVRA